MVEPPLLLRTIYHAQSADAAIAFEWICRPAADEQCTKQHDAENPHSPNDGYRSGAAGVCARGFTSRARISSAASVALSTTLVLPSG
jgi:hypothetical protein